ncbi:amidohydrolase [Paenisporosarcina cavernae]|uniref:Amidohydrolase n=1 Tax=Paenisporosarcina cavernae TaxID=2320858 RepID=A0A385YWL0_9BACL|nr:amidohydrolase [Paenisporosarcina cavernae]AYC29902.1 amidohydrolase [Paenisporosarcina cavernae]
MKTLMHNGTIYTMNAEMEQVESILIEEGKILRTGSVKDLRELADHFFDLQGATVFPGFVDSHLHLIGHGDKIRYLDLSKFTSSKEMVEAISEAATEQNDSDWFVAEGWNENNFADRKILHRVELDEISTSPIVLRRICRHAMLVNSKVLELVGITKDTPDPEDGVIVRDQLGEPTGYLLDGAQNLVFQAIPEKSLDQLTLSVKAAVEDLVSKGFTGVHTEDMSYYGHYSRPFHAINTVVPEHLPFRINLLRHHAVFEEMMQDELIYPIGFVEGGAMKLFMDGALGGRTALLTEPYADDPSTQGVAIHSQEQLDELVTLARKHNEAVAVHAIGDLAMEMVVTAIEKNPPPKGKRDRLIHANVLYEALVKRIEQLPVVLDIQPSFVTSDFPWVIERLGEDRVEWAYAWKKLLTRGIACSGGSDSPIEEVDPLLAMYAAIARKLPGESHDGYLPEEGLTRFEAISLYTTGSAFATSQEDERGKIAEGYVADFTIFDRDLFTIELEDFTKATVLYTIVDGKIVYQHGGTSEVI